jgi:hypothetical protein
MNYTEMKDNLSDFHNLKFKCKIATLSTFVGFILAILLAIIFVIGAIAINLDFFNIIEL